MALSRGINVIDVVGIEPDGDALSARRSVIAGDVAEPAYPVEDGIQLHLNQGGINEMTDMIEGVAEALGEDLNPVFATDEVLWTWAAADLEDIDFGAVEITASPDEMIELEVVLSDRVIDVYAYGEIAAIDFTQDVSMTADRVILTAGLALGAADGILIVALIDPEVELQGFAYDTSLLPSFMEDYFFIESIQDTIEDTLVEQMEEMVPALLDDQHEALDFSVETEVMAATICVDAPFSGVSVDEDGVEISVDVDVPSVGALIFGSYLASGAGKPPIDKGADVAMVLSDELLNRLLFEVWRGGGLDLTLSPPTMAAWSLRCSACCAPSRGP